MSNNQDKLFAKFAVMCLLATLLVAIIHEMYIWLK